MALRVNRFLASVAHSGSASITTRSSDADNFPYPQQKHRLSNRHLKAMKNNTTTQTLKSGQTDPPFRFKVTHFAYRIQHKNLNH